MQNIQYSIRRAIASKGYGVLKNKKLLCNLLEALSPNEADTITFIRKIYTDEIGNKMFDVGIAEDTLDAESYLNEIDLILKDEEGRSEDWRKHLLDSFRPSIVGWDPSDMDFTDITSVEGQNDDGFGTNGYNPHHMYISGESWEPGRRDFSVAAPSDFVTFNSFVDNETIEDERNFLRYSLNNNGYDRKIPLLIEPGRQYSFRIYYNNNCQPELNKGGKGIAKGVKARVRFPHDVKKNESKCIEARIETSNAFPQDICDTLCLTTKYPQVLLRFKIGAAHFVMKDRWPNNGAILPETLFEKGAYLGLGIDTRSGKGVASPGLCDGVIPAGEDFYGYIEFTLISYNASCQVDRTLSTDGINYSKVVDVNRGDIVSVRTEFQNSGTRDLTNVCFHDVLEPEIELVDDTTIINNLANMEGKRLSNLIDKNGYNTGLYGSGASARIEYKVRINAEKGNSLLSRSFVDHDAGEIADGTIINVR